LYECIALISARWGAPGQIWLVVGATQPEALRRVRAIRPQTWILAPGVGAQGADLAIALQAGLRSDGMGLIIPVSRGVLLADDPRASCATLRDQINLARTSIKKEPPLSPNESLILSLFETGCIRFGQFTLASGAVSPIYIDLRRLVSFPDLFSRAAEAYAERSREIQYDLLSGVPYAALPISAVAALRLHKGMIYPRKEAKTHGTGQSIEGVFTQGQVALLYEDVITSGGSILAAAGVLRAAGLIVRDVVVLVNRSHGGREALAADGITLHAILTMDEILDVLEKKQLVAADLLQQVKSYIKGQA